MKRLLIFVFILMGCFYSIVQGQGITYQAVILNPDGKSLPGFDNPSMPMSDKDICLKFSFINDLGENEHEEVIATTTDVFGMINVVIGTGERIGGTAQSFEQIIWDSKPKSMEVSLDKDGLCAQFVQISLQQFTAVPFALFALNAGEAKSEALAGKSAYEIWLELGNAGTVAEFINSLTGPAGADGVAGVQGASGIDGDKGDTGDEGPIGPKGDAGDIGPIGAKGDTGGAGIQGEKGDIGPAGPQGT